MMVMNLEDIPVNMNSMSKAMYIVHRILNPCSTVTRSEDPFKRAFMWRLKSIIGNVLLIQ